MESDDLTRLQASLPRIEPGEGRSFEMQAVYQVIGLAGTLAIALLAGLITGNILIPFNMHSIVCNCLYFRFHIPADDNF